MDRNGCPNSSEYARPANSGSKTQPYEPAGPRKIPLGRGHIDAGDYKQFIFPLLFFKRICDVFDEEYALDADIIDEIAGSADPKKVKQLEKELKKRLKKHGDHPRFKDLSERLEELRNKAEKGLIASIE